MVDSRSNGEGSSGLTLRYLPSSIQYNIIQNIIIQYNTVQYGTVWYSKVQYLTVQYSIVKYSTVQYFTELYNTEGELYSTVQYRRRVVEGHHSTR